MRAWIAKRDNSFWDLRSQGRKRKMDDSDSKRFKVMWEFYANKPIRPNMISIISMKNAAMMLSCTGEVGNQGENKWMTLIQNAEFESENPKYLDFRETWSSWKSCMRFHCIILIRSAGELIPTRGGHRKRDDRLAHGLSISYTRFWGGCRYRLASAVAI